jgi:hypothetical protein
LFFYLINDGEISLTVLRPAINVFPLLRASLLGKIPITNAKMVAPQRRQQARIFYFENEIMIVFYYNFLK